MDSVYDEDDVDDEFLVSPAHVDAVLNFMEQTETTSKTPSVGRGKFVSTKQKAQIDPETRVHYI